MLVLLSFVVGGSVVAVVAVAAIAAVAVAVVAAALLLSL